MKLTTLWLAMLVITTQASAQTVLQRDLISAGGIKCTAGTTTLAGSFGGHAFGSISGPSILVMEGFWFPAPGDPSGIGQVAAIRHAFRFLPVFPNPARPQASISYTVPGHGDEQVPVSIEVFDVTGRRVVTLANRAQAPGAHVEQWTGLDCAGRTVAPGVYYCRLQAGSFSATRTLVVMK